MRFDDDEINNHLEMLNRKIEENKKYFLHKVLRGL